MNAKMLNLIVYSILGIFISMLLIFWNMQITKANIMSKDIQAAMDKGIDPLSVRCTYAQDSDNICLAYALKRVPESTLSKNDSNHRSNP